MLGNMHWGWIGAEYSAVSSPGGKHGPGFCI